MKKQLTLLICFLVIIFCLALYGIVGSQQNSKAIESNSVIAKKGMIEQDSIIEEQKEMLLITQEALQEQQSRIIDLEKVIYHRDSVILRQKRTIYTQNKKINDYQNTINSITIPHSDLENRYSPGSGQPQR